MGLREDFERSGNRLFRWRSFLPLVILPALLIALRESEYLNRAIGHLAEFFWEIFCVAVSYLLDIVADLLTEGKFEIDLAWRISFVLSSAAYVVIRTLKTRTRVLHVAGR